MATHSSILAWRIAWTEEPGRLQFTGCWSDMTEQLPFPLSLSWIGEGNGNPLQCSCPENPRDGGAWWAAVHGVAQSRTRLKRLSSSSSSSVYMSMPLSQFFLHSVPTTSPCPQVCSPSASLFLPSHVFSFLLDIQLGLNLLGHMITQ